MEPAHCAMTNTHLLVASKDVVYLWRYSDSLAKDTADISGRLRAMTVADSLVAASSYTECIWGIDDQPPSEPRPVGGFVPPILVTAYPISCVALNSTHVVVVRASGIAQLFRLLPTGGVAAEGEVVLRPNPSR